jgi:WhiB family redox-sensing transcriptional regulator
MTLHGVLDELDVGERARHPGSLVDEAARDGWLQALGGPATAFPRYLDTGEGAAWRAGWSAGRGAAVCAQPLSRPLAPPRPPPAPVAVPTASPTADRRPPRRAPRPAAGPATLRRRGGPAPYPAVDGSQACATTDPELWFPDQGGSSRQAIALCGTCEWQRPCLDYALTATAAGYPLAGIWGGTTPRDRAALRRLTAAGEVA